MSFVNQHLSLNTLHAAENSTMATQNCVTSGYNIAGPINDVALPHREEGSQQKEFQCPVCLKFFSRKFTLEMHLLIHKGIKPHQCPFCGKCFRQKGTLMRHKALHSSTALFHCQLCNKNYRQKNVFLHHLRHRHMVRTDNLDRRKCTTQLADAESLAEELPPFAVADKTALNASDKKLEAMLFSSLKTVGNETNANDPAALNDTQGRGPYQSDHQHQQDFLDALAYGMSSGNLSALNNPFLLSSLNNCSRIVAQNGAEKSGSSPRNVTIKWECNVCSYKCPLDSPECEAHLKIHKSKHPYECVSCKMLFSTATSYREHVMYHERIQSFSTKDSSSNSRNAVDLNHQTSKVPALSASRCNEAVLPSVTQHLQTDALHPPTCDREKKQDNGRSFDLHCIPCQMDFANEEDFECHVKTHVQTYLVCDSSDSDNFPDAANVYKASRDERMRGRSVIQRCSSSSANGITTNGTMNGKHPEYRPINRTTNKDEHPKANQNKNDEDADTGESTMHMNGFNKVQNGNSDLRNGIDCQKKPSKLKKQPEGSSKKKGKIYLPVYCCPFCERYFPDRPRLRTHVLTHMKSFISTTSFQKSSEKLDPPPVLDCSLKSSETTEDSSLSPSSPQNNKYEIMSLRNLQLLLATDNKEVTVCSQNDVENMKSHLSDSKKHNVGPKDAKEHPELMSPHKIRPSSKRALSKSNIVYLCRKCNKTFCKRTLFRYHNHLHLSLPKLKCSFCRQSFSRKDRLLRHTRMKHIASYRCSYCQKQFQYRTIHSHHEETCRDRTALVPKSVVDESPLCVPVIRIKDVPLDTDAVLGIIPVAGVGENIVSEGLQIAKYGIPVISPHMLLSEGKQTKPLPLPIIGKIILSELTPPNGS